MAAPTYAQKLDYRYNIRGWLTRINEPGAMGTDLFAQELLYDTVRTGLNNSPQYNGNISGKTWRDAYTNARPAYRYGYDALSRLTTSTYGVLSGSSFSQTVGTPIISPR